MASTENVGKWYVIIEGGERMFRLASLLLGIALFSGLSSPVLAQSRQAPIGIRVDGDYGQVLTDQYGWTLYWYDQDQVGVSNCTGACLEEWRPLLWDPGLTNDEVLAQIDRGPLGFIVRPDGWIQVTWDGYPVYLYEGDAQPGEITGQGTDGDWWVVTLPPDIIEL
jgi:predicted lipoprotein with Yx(FWY)xxD motif